MIKSKEKIFKLLKIIKKKKQINYIDYYCCIYMLDQCAIEIALMILFLSQASNQGHNGLPITVLEKKKIYFNNKLKILWGEILKNKNWVINIKKNKFCSNGSKKTPIIFKKGFFYLYKYWKYEEKLIDFVKKRFILKKTTIIKDKKLFDKYCPKNINTLQKLAIGIMLLNNITLLIGGPGTGKTSILAIFIFIFMKKKKNANIQLIAPTGKAAAKLQESIYQILRKYYIKNIKKKMLPNNVHTLHSFFKINITKTKNNQFLKEKYKNLDLLIIDESSMLDIYMMNLIIDNISKKTKIIFSGDKNQLPPINIGNFFQDLCKFQKNKYSVLFSKKIKYITNFEVSQEKKNVNYTISDSIIMLYKNYRFHKKSGIKKLSEIIKKKKNLNDIINNKYNDVIWHTIDHHKNYQKMIKKNKLFYKKYWKYTNEEKNKKKIINFFCERKILCAVNNGIFGVKKINHILDEYFYKKSQHYKFQEWYHGRPIMFTQNDSLLEIYNGNIGICLLNKKKNLKIFFISKKNKIKKIDILTIPDYEISWAISIHKSQGSEFLYVQLIIPIFFNRILTRELLYTGATRSSKKITIYSTIDSIKKIIKNKTKRYSNFRKLINDSM